MAIPGQLVKRIPYVELCRLPVPDGLLDTWTCKNGYVIMVRTILAHITTRHGPKLANINQKPPSSFDTQPPFPNDDAELRSFLVEEFKPLVTSELREKYMRWLHEAVVRLIYMFKPLSTVNCWLDKKEIQSAPVLRFSHDNTAEDRTVTFAVCFARDTGMMELKTSLSYPLGQGPNADGKFTELPPTSVSAPVIITSSPIVDDVDMAPKIEPTISSSSSSISTPPLLTKNTRATVTYNDIFF